MSQQQKAKQAREQRIKEGLQPGHKAGLNPRHAPATGAIVAWDGKEACGECCRLWKLAGRFGL
jgi:hypothetical protein